MRILKFDFGCNAGMDKGMKISRRFFLLLSLILLVGNSRGEDALHGVKRILFLGDSITYAGEYVIQCDVFLRRAFPDRSIEVINAGLPSETVSGLSEEGHAGGSFPRPDLHERLDRILALTKPDLVFACYGMNCGIYLPLDASRMEKYQDGINRLHDAVQKSGAKIIHLTPALFDNGPKPSPLGYDDVLQRYSEWLLWKQEKDGWVVGDVHHAMRIDLDAKRERDAAFRYSKDGVHINADGHRAIAVVVVGLMAPSQLNEFKSFLAGPWWNSPESEPLKSIVAKRMVLLKDAALTTAGHKRPGMTKGIPFADALATAAAMEPSIKAALPK